MKKSERINYKATVIQAHFDALLEEDKCRIWDKYCNVLGRLDRIVYSMDRFNDFMETVSPKDIVNYCYDVRPYDDDFFECDSDGFYTSFCEMECSDWYWEEDLVDWLAFDDKHLGLVRDYSGNELDLKLEAIQNEITEGLKDGE